MAYKRPEPPSEPGQWTLLQSRLDRSFWQWDRELPKGVFSHFVILRGAARHEYDTFDEAEELFLTLDGEDPELPVPEANF